MPYALPAAAPYIPQATTSTAQRSTGSSAPEEHRQSIHAQGTDLLGKSEISLEQPGLTDTDYAVANWILGSASSLDESFERLSPTFHDRRWFEQLAVTWTNDMRFSSSSTEMFQHPAYRAIMRMGRVAVPMLLRELDRRPNHWFYALKRITGADPVPVAHRGRLTEMAEAWLRWGRSHGIAW